ncbi:MAG: putative toxin-antitoxin system toxin component, PIN family [Candidatus Aminicenantales bacterium]
MRIFLDTNILVSAVATRGLCADALREVLTFHEIIISEKLLSELRESLARKLGVPKSLVEEFVEILVQDAHFADPNALPGVNIRDRDDLTILSAALNGKADLFITGDKELLTLRSVGPMDIVNPRKFWEVLRARGRSRKPR